jgi:hypothetical protein
MQDEEDISESEKDESQDKEDNKDNDSCDLKELVELLNAFSGKQPVSNQNVASQAYNEHFQPAASELGKTATTISKTINMALSPVKGMVWCYEQIETRLSGLLAEKMENVPAEKISPPPIHVAGPAIEAMRFSGEQPQLQQMFANLITNSMNSGLESYAHPAFV